MSGSFVGGFAFNCVNNKLLIIMTIWANSIQKSKIYQKSKISKNFKNSQKSKKTKIYQKPKNFKIPKIPKFQKFSKWKKITKWRSAEIWPAWSSSPSWTTSWFYAFPGFSWVFSRFSCWFTSRSESTISAGKRRRYGSLTSSSWCLWAWFSATSPPQ